METPTFSATVSPLHHPSSTADPASTSASTSSSAPSSSGAPLLVSSRKRSASMYEEQDDPRLAPTLSGHREGSTLAEEGESAGPSTVEQPASEPRSGLLRRGELARKAVERRKGTGSVVSTRGVGGPSGMARSRSEGGLTALLGEGGDGPTLKRRKEDHEGTGTFIQVDSFLSPTTPPLDLPLAPLDPTFAPPPFPTIDSLAPPTAFLSSLPFPSPTPPLAPTPLSPALPSRAGPHRRERSFSLPTPLKRSHSVPYLSSRPASSFQPSHGRKHKFYETPRRQRAAETESPSAKLLPSQLLALHTVYSLPRVGVPGRGVLLEATPLGPPITRTTLKELDLHEILRNPQLRHDVVFDPNLMFRPNHDGERGDRKRLAASQYWNAVSREIFHQCRCSTFSSTTLLPCLCLSTPVPLSPRLPSRIGPLILELRNILLSLLPTPSPPSLAERLDPEGLERQMERGEMDVVGLARFLAGTLKMHCAPMRDDMVDEMVRACEEGGEGVTKGLRMCFEVLELMKLDIANHQLRSLRPYLLQTALEFELKSFSDFTSRSTSASSFDRTRAWLTASATTVSTKLQPRSLGKAALVERTVSEGILELIFRPSDASPPLSSIPLSSTFSVTSSSPSRPSSPSSSWSLPETLQLDAYRLQAFHADAIDLTVVYMLLLLFQQLASPSRVTGDDLDVVRKEIWCIMSAPAGSHLSLVEPSAGAGIPAGPPGQGIKKLECPIWRNGMGDVLLQIGARAKAVQSRSKGHLDAPDQRTIDLVEAYFETNMRADSRLFLLLQARLQATLGAVLQEELGKEEEGRAGWWLPRPVPFVETGRRGASGGCVTRPTPLVVSARSMARGTKRAHEEERDESSEEEEGGEKMKKVEGRERGAVEGALKKNGLGALEAEVRVLGERVAKVASFHLKVYQGWYATLLSSTP